MNKLSENDIENLGIEEYYEKGGVTIIEWADLIKDYLPERRVDIKIKIIDENTRVVKIIPYGEEYVNLIEGII